MKKPLILFGAGDLAQIACLYFNRDTDYYVVGFTVDDGYMNETELMGLPVVPFSTIERVFPPQTHEMHVCLVYNNLNRDRARKCIAAKHRGYTLASYISPHAFVAPTVILGEHCFIFENNVIQDFVKIGKYCVMWSGNHCGHSSIIGDSVFISSHVVISGWCNIGSNTFIGVNSSLANNTVIGAETWISHGACISGAIPPNSFVKSPKSEVIPLNEESLNRALDRARK